MILAIFGYGTLAVIAYVFTVGVMARRFRRHDWFHSGAPKHRHRSYACPRVREGHLPPGECSCDEWMWWAWVWPGVLAVVVARAAFLHLVIEPLAGLMLAGFNLGQPTPDSDTNDQPAEAA